MALQRRALSRDARESAGAMVARIACSLPAFRLANRVAAYVALDDEMPTREILDTVLASGRVLLLPRVVAAGLEFAAVEKIDSLRTGPFGVLEARASSTAVQLAPGDLAFVPGVAFDRSGGRLGRGGGHYDRAFPPAPAAPLLIGIAFSLQLIESVPMGPFDRRVDGVITEVGSARILPPTGDPSRDPG